MKSVYKYIDMLRALEDYDEIIRASRVALDIDAFDERLHLDLMDALVKSGRNNESLQQYRHATHMYYRYLGSQPPAGIQEFYKQIITAGNELEMNIDIIPVSYTHLDVYKRQGHGHAHRQRLSH